MEMTFTYQAYGQMLDMLAAGGYRVAGYQEATEMPRCVILRHDVDTSLEKAVEMAEIERGIGVSSTYFVLLTSDFYNALSQEGRRSVRRIQELGHTVGLHFDETLYPQAQRQALTDAVCQEADILAQVCGKAVDAVSMHRPSRLMLDGDFRFPGMVNVYGRTFFRDFKYLSDSRRHWREPVLDIIRSGSYPRLHILTHPFWYGQKERSLEEAVRSLVNQANRARYGHLRDNITRLEDIMTESEVR